jgi:hypothetical protein
MCTRLCGVCGCAGQCERVGICAHEMCFSRGGTNDVVCVSCRVGGVCVHEVGKCVGLCFYVVSMFVSMFVSVLGEGCASKGNEIVCRIHVKAHQDIRNEAQLVDTRGARVCAYFIRRGNRTCEGAG